MKAVRNLFRNIRVISSMVYSIMLGRAYLKKFEPQTLCYCHSGDNEMMLDLFKPTTPSDKPLPVIVWFHGGAWKMGNRQSMERIVAEQLDRGFAVATVSYSLSDIALWPTQCHEGKAAIRYLRANASELGIEANKMIAAGMSAGAHMACMLGVSSEHKQLNGELGDHTDQSNQVQGVLALYPPTDFLSVPEDYDGLLDYYAVDSPVTELLGETISKAPHKADLASPLKLVNNQCPPTLLLHGDADPIVPIEQSELMHSALLAVGVDSDFMPIAGYTHGDYRFNRDKPAQKISQFLDRLNQ